MSSFYRQFPAHLFFLLNFIQMIAGVLVLTQGLYLIQVHVLPIVIFEVLIGLQIVGIGMLGCYGVLMCSTKHLYKFVYFQYGTTIMYFMYLVFLLVFTKTFDQFVIRIYVQMFKNRDMYEFYTDVIEFVQTRFNCCGVLGPKDYRYSAGRSLLSRFKEIMGISSLLQLTCSDESTRLGLGCAPKLTSFVKSYVLTFAFFIILLEIAALFMSQFAISAIRRKQEMSADMKNKDLFSSFDMENKMNVCDEDMPCGPKVSS